MALAKWKGYRLGNAQSFLRLPSILSRDPGEQQLIMNFILSLAYKSEVDVDVVTGGGGDSPVSEDTDLEDYANQLYVVDSEGETQTFSPFPYAACWNRTISGDQECTLDGGTSTTIQFNVDTIDTHGFAYGNGIKIPEGLSGYYHVGASWEFYLQESDVRDAFYYNYFILTRASGSTEYPLFAELFGGNDTEQEDYSSFPGCPWAGHMATDIYLYAGDELVFVVDGFMDAAFDQDVDYKAPNTMLYGHLIGLALPGEEP